MQQPAIAIPTIAITTVKISFSDYASSRMHCRGSNKGIVIYTTKYLKNVSNIISLTVVNFMFN